MPSESISNAKNFLQGSKAFIIILDDEKPWRGICKSYDMLTFNNILWLKITIDTLIGNESYNFSK